MHKPMTANDFTSSELRLTWQKYQRAIEYIEQRIASGTMSAEGVAIFNKLIESHRDKIACLERAQRIINTIKLVDVSAPVDGFQF